jgi:hypothetical protein
LDQVQVTVGITVVNEIREMVEELLEVESAAPRPHLELDVGRLGKQELSESRRLATDALEANRANSLAEALRQFVAFRIELGEALASGTTNTLAGRANACADRTNTIAELPHGLKEKSKD